MNKLIFNFLSKHHRGCKARTFSGSRECTCGRDVTKIYIEVLFSLYVDRTFSTWLGAGSTMEEAMELANKEIERRIKECQQPTMQTEATSAREAKHGS